jgi:hypothetical protein
MSVFLSSFGVACARGVGREDIFAGDAPLVLSAPGLAQFAGRAVGRLPAVELGAYLSQKKSRKLMSRASLLAVAAARVCVEGEPFSADTGLFVSVGMSGGEISDLAGLLDESLSPSGELDLYAFGSRGLARLNPLLSFHVLNNMPLCHVSIELGLAGPHAAFYAESPADGLAAWVRAVEAVARREAPLVLVGGAEAPVHTLGLALSPAPPVPPAEGAAFALVSSQSSPGALRWLGVGEGDSLDSAWSALGLSGCAPALVVWAGPGDSPVENAVSLAALVGDGGAASFSLGVALVAQRLRESQREKVAALCGPAPFGGVWMLALAKESP